MRYGIPRSIAAAVLVAGALLAAPAGAAQDTPDPEKVLEAFVETAAQIEADLDAGRVGEDQVEPLRAELERKLANIAAIRTTAEAGAAPLIAERKALGPPPDDGSAEPPAIAKQRERLGNEIAAFETLAKRAQQAAARARALGERLNELRRTRFRERLLSRGPSPLGPGYLAAAWQSIEARARVIADETRTQVAGASSVSRLVDRLALPLVLAVIALVLAGAVRGWAVRRLERAATADAPRARRIGLGIAVTLARLLMPAVAVGLVLLGLANSGLVGPIGEHLVGALVEAAAILIGASALGRAFYAPAVSVLRTSTLDDADAAAAYRWLFVLAAITAADRVLIGGGAEIGLENEALGAINAGLLIAGGVALWLFIRAARIGVRAAADAGEPAGQQRLDQISEVARYVGMAAAVSAPVLALAGYYGAARFFFYPLILSAAVIGFMILIQRLIRALLTPTPTEDETDEPEAAEAAQAGQPQGGIVALATGFLLTLAAIPVLALIWGADTTDLLSGWRRVVEGFTLGDVTISPIDFLAFVIAFAIGYVLTRLIKGIMRRSVLPVTRLDQGAKSAILAGIGYVGIVISALVAISAAGLDLSNIAIVAGALSVGIGFGLQNVVNNFVSGIILLIERPIQTGDWVEISGVHGTVQRIRVRSTEIQTFDRSTMFVPNADLISGTVTNWTHGNSLGRLIVRVGVAYGSDAREVERILQEIGEAHPMLTEDPAPFVVFAGFGADSLDFELRGVLRDVNKMIRVASDLRHSIYERFTEAGIQIPFAQRDIYIKNLGEVGEALRGEPKAPPGEGA